jgi:hypothetical protein
MQVGSKVRVIKDTYPHAGLNTGATGTVVGYAENDQGARLYAVDIDDFAKMPIAPEIPGQVGTLKGWAYLSTEVEEA